MTSEILARDASFVYNIAAYKDQTRL
jgi:hypothetical protein